MPSYFNTVLDDSVQQRESVQAVYEPQLPSLSSDEIKAKADCQVVTECQTVTDPIFKTVYSIRVKGNEFPVIGTYIDERITPGFYYRVRRLATDDYLWNGEARCLLSIGMGYGKRITFRGDDVLNSHDYYFYSDTEVEGFAFTPAVPETFRRFAMHDEDGRTTAEVKLTSFKQVQIELGSKSESRDLTKRIACAFTCDIHMTSRPGGIIPLQSSFPNCELQGVANICRKDRQPATLESIDGIHISQHGTFTFIPV